MSDDLFAHRLRVDQIRDGDRFDLSADADERGAIAKRLGLKAVERLEAHVTMKRDPLAIRATGRLAAVVIQDCVVTGEPLTGHVDEAFDIQFTPEPETGSAEEEIELGTKDCDIVFYDGAAIDLGTAIADTLALSIDPYPRSAGADAALKEAGIMTEAEASPFAALAALKLDRDKP